MPDEKTENEEAKVGQPEGPTSPLPSAVVIDLAAEPDYPPPDSVPRPAPLSAPKVYPIPVVHDIAPDHGSVLGDTKLTLSGQNLLRISIVRVGGIIAQTIGADEPRELRVLTPAGTKPGEVEITVENPFVPPAILSKAFRYDSLAAPRVASVAPDHVATKGGTELTIVGEGFVKSSVVLLDGKAAQKVRFVSATALDVVAPSGDDGRMVDVSVKNPDGQTAVVRRAFVYDKRYG